MNLKNKFKNSLTDKEFELLDTFGKPYLDDIIRLSINNNIDLNVVIEFFVDKYKDEISSKKNKLNMC